MRLRPALLATAVVALGACRNDAPDAYGNFEAVEVVIAAEAGGQLLRFTPREGDRLDAGADVGTIDTTTLALQRRELLARQQTVRARIAEVRAQEGVLQAQRTVAQREYERAKRLADAQAATAQQLDRAERDVRTLAEQMVGARAASETVVREVGAIKAQIAVLQERIVQSRIENPARGVVLTTYVEQGEVVQPGQPLYKVADLDTLTLRAYVSGAQLAAVKLGQQVSVRVDAGDKETRLLSGRVAWIASSAEFTPTPIQTRDERADQVYAVKIRVANPDGSLKIGMPGELELSTSGERIASTRQADSPSARRP